MARRRRREVLRPSMKNPARERIDVLLVEQGLATSRQRAQALLLAGNVRVDCARITKAGTRVSTAARIEVVGESNPYASRGGLKLEGALQDFGISPQGQVCLDVGSSTGGFTDCLLQHGASKISAAKILPGIAAIAAPGADFLILVKPQFELEKRDVGKGGIVRDPALHEKAIKKVAAAAKAVGLETIGVKPSRLPGAEGNQEFFLHARRPTAPSAP